MDERVPRPHLRGTTNGDAGIRSGGALTTLAEQLAGRICSLSFEALPADVEAALEQLSDLGDLVDLTVGARS